MTVEQLRSALKASPFRPFVLHLADGNSVPVRHPELVVASQSGRTTVVVEPNDSFSIVDLLLVTRMEFGGVPPTRSRRRDSA